MSRADLIVRTAFLLVVAVLCICHAARPATSREFGEVRWGHASRVVRLPVDERSWLSYGPGRPAGYIGHPGVIERPAGFEFHRGAINLGGR